MLPLADDYFDSDESAVDCLANLLERLVHANESKPQSSGLLMFQSAYAADVSIHAYLTRIQKYANCSRACLVIAMIYIDRLIEAKNGIILSKLNVHRLLITGILLAVKYHDDLFYNNAYFAKLGGISLGELNTLEVHMFRALDFNVTVSVECYSMYYSKLVHFARSVMINEQQLAMACMTGGIKSSMSISVADMNYYPPVVNAAGAGCRSGCQEEKNNMMTMYQRSLSSLGDSDSRAALDSPSSYMCISGAPSPCGIAHIPCGGYHQAHLVAGSQFTGQQPQNFVMSMPIPVPMSVPVSHQKGFSFYPPLVTPTDYYSAAVPAQQAQMQAQAAQQMHHLHVQNGLHQQQPMCQQFQPGMYNMDSAARRLMMGEGDKDCHVG